MDTEKTFYITKWCLSHGILAVKCRVSHNGREAIGSLSLTTTGQTTHLTNHVFQIDSVAFEKKSDAERKACHVAHARIHGLKKQERRFKELLKTWGGYDAWEDDAVQFPRMLAEVRAAGLTLLQCRALRESMDLTDEQVESIFTRAEQEWELLKKETE